MRRIVTPHSVAPLIAAVLCSALSPQAHGQFAASGVPGAPRTVEISLSAQTARIELVAGVVTPVYAYNGQVPGPTLEFTEGDQVVVTFRNDLPVETTVHWHGFHLPFEADGSPFHPVAPGETYEYRFVVPIGTAGTYWYHPHPDHKTGPQVARGLYGSIIVRAADDPLVGLPERVLILSDNRLTPEGEIDLPDPHSMAGRIDRENGREGDLLLVNGKVLPTLSIRSGEVQRWRVINASAGRSYRLALNGQPLVWVGTGGGLFDKPVEVPELLIAPSERVEFLVRGTGAPGSSTTLQALGYNRYVPQTRPANWKETRELVRLETTGEAPVALPRIPEQLRHVEPMDTSLATAIRVLALGQGMINGKLMDMTRIDVSTTVGATEIWQLENLVGMDHPFHLHGFRFQVLERNGVKEPFPAWRDAVNVPKHETVRLIVRYDDFPGKWMFHCHILDHEDHGMMGVLEVRKP